MKALTIYQPWASLIIAGAKPYEFRGWKPPASIIGQRIGIHASARKIDRTEVHWLLRDPKQKCLHAEVARPILERVLSEPSCMPLAHMLGTAILGAPKAGDACAREFGIEAGGNDSDRDGTFNYGWPLTEIEPLEPPEPMRGLQGLWEWKRHPFAGRAQP